MARLTASISVFLQQSLTNMTDWSAEFMPPDRQLFPRSLGELLAVFVRRQWPRDTAKRIASRWDVDPSTAVNVTKGHASERTITKALAAEGWPLLIALGEAVTGKPYEQHLEDIANERDRAAERARARKDRLRDLERRAGVLVARGGGPDAALDQ